MRLTLAVLPVALLLISSTALSDAAAVPPVTVRGRVERLVYGPDGRADAIVLQDHTVIQFHPKSLSNAAQIRFDDPIFAKGLPVLLKPNRAMDRVVVGMRGKVILNDTKSVSAPRVGVRSALPKFKSVRDSSVLLAAGARPDGEVKRLVLADRTVVEIPPGSYIDPSQIQLGQQIHVQGVGTQVRNERFIEAMNVEGADHTTLLSARTGFAEQWTMKTGTIRQMLLDPSGRVNGVLLLDNSAIRFYPVPPDQVNQLTPGTGVQAAGPTLANQLRTSFLLLTGPDQVLEITPGGVLSRTTQEAGIAARGSAPTAAEAGATRQPLIPLKDTARITTVLRGPDQNIESLVLDDGARIQIPMHLQKSLPADLRVGRTIEVLGRGGKYPEGTSIEANSIQVTEAASEVG